MSIDLSSITEIRDKIGVVTQIADASGRVLWSATITFTINGDTYIADRGMTWAEWFASSHNTTGKTADDVQSISANGTAVALDAIIVGGMAYEVGFGPAIVTITITGNMYASAVNKMGYVKINGIEYGRTGSETTEVIEIPVGTVITCRVVAQGDYVGEIIVNGEIVASAAGSGMVGFGRAVNYDYTATKNAVIEARYESKPFGEQTCYRGVIIITET